MADFKRVDLYQKGRVAGVTAIRPVEDGPLGQRRMRLNADHVTVIYALGVASNDSNVFEVNLDGAKSFITDWNGISDISNFVRINKYTLTLQPAESPFEGQYKWQYFGTGVGSSARVVPMNVASCVSVKANGVDENGDDINQECFRVTMVDGRSFVTDHDGWDAIQNY